MKTKHTPETKDAPVPRRPTLTLKKKAPATHARVSPGPMARYFFINWRTDGYRPKRRHATLESALTEKERLLGLSPEAVIQTFECHMVEQTP